MSTSTDEYGWCVTCGGHGSLMVRLPVTPENLATLRPRAQERAITEGVVWGSKPCPTCDGTDHVTPYAEAQVP